MPKFFGNTKDGLLRKRKDLLNGNFGGSWPLIRQETRDKNIEYRKKMKTITAKLETSTYLTETISGKIETIVQKGKGTLETDYNSGTIKAIFTNKEMYNLNHSLYIELEKISELHQINLEYRISTEIVEEFQEPEYVGTFSPPAKYGME